MARWRALKEAPRSAATVGELMDDYIKARVAEGALEDTMTWNLKPIRPHFGALKPEDVSAPYVRGYLVRRRRHGIAESTIGRELRQLRAVLNWGVREGRITQAPTFSCPGEAAARDRWLTHAEFDAMVAAAPSLHVRTFLHLAVYTGARMGAVLALRWDQVDFANKIIAFPRPRADAKKRVSPKAMPTKLEAMLQSARQMARTAWVIEWAGDRVQKLRNPLMLAAKKAGVADFRVHDLRRTCAVWMLQAGGDFDHAAAQLDDNVRTVQKHYAHHAPGHLRAVLERM
jgi:integrase